MTLRGKITVAMLLVVVVATSIFGLISNYTIKNIFNTYIENQRLMMQAQWANYLESYYSQNGSWQGVEMFFKPIPGRQRFSRRWLMEERFILLDNKQEVIYDSEPGGENYAELIKKGQPLALNDQLIGYVVLSPRTHHQLLPLEEEFYRSIKRMVLLGGLFSMLVAIGLGVMYSRRITLPLLKLTQAVQAMTSPERGMKVQVTGDDEIGDLAKSYNDMIDSLVKHEQIRKNLVADVAHELRTPLAVLRGNLETLLDGETLPTQAVISSLHDEVIRMSRLVTDLQELTLVEAGKLKLNLGPTNLKQLMQQIATTVGFEAEARGINLICDVDIAPQEEVVLDKDRITQVIMNLLTNALKHTPSGGTVSLEARHIGEGLKFAVQDTGTGIPEEHLPHIFNRFYRADKSRSRAEGGVGLGLAIAKGFVEAHGGRIWVESNPGTGTRFIFTIPKMLSE